jgi:hypothetical protein
MCCSDIRRHLSARQQFRSWWMDSLSLGQKPSPWRPRRAAGGALQPVFSDVRHLTVSVPQCAVTAAACFSQRRCVRRKSGAALRISAHSTATKNHASASRGSRAAMRFLCKRWLPRVSRLHSEPERHRKADARDHRCVIPRKIVCLSGRHWRRASRRMPSETPTQDGTALARGFSSVVYKYCGPACMTHSLWCWIPKISSLVACVSAALRMLMPSHPHHVAPAVCRLM